MDDEMNGDIDYATLDGEDLTGISNGRRRLLCASVALPAAALAHPIRGWANGHGPADELPAIHVTAPSETSLPLPSPGGPAGGYSWTTGLENYRGGIFQIGKFKLVNGKRIFAAASEGRTIDALAEFAYGIELSSNKLIQAQIATYGLFTQWLANNGWRDIVGANEYGLSNTTYSGLTAAFGLFSDYYFSRLPAPPISDFRFYATPFFTLAAYDYWFRGNGASRTVDLPSLRLGIGVKQIDAIKNIVVNDGMGPGVYPIDAVFSTNLISENEWIVGAALGRVSGHVTGQLTLAANGGYSFLGEYTLNPDRFDFDVSRSRPDVQERLTTLVRKLGEIAGHTDFTIYFNGSQKVDESGTRASIKAMAGGGPILRPSFGGRAPRRLGAAG
ncbi:hypothetical protein WS67_12395 [Burkholderia singularis]|uniref:Lipid II-degrading bacteriocin n=2 Tax=Burkholderiaceae TaxID=119060 RepID=A0A103E2S6_9BURK|nr:hypothetical protein AQ611_07730 [Burkholderia sp. Bp7605]KVE27287.1 hypothetical protein WS67_12395 [Burkholderia singularis]